ncbi:MAG: DUF47 family protein [Verrucomicrobiales bacterium]|nr:DUF47 family protein [Verrucomicrobiales bacterium]
MISFQRILGREQEFFDLIQASAAEGCKAVKALAEMIQPGTKPTVEAFAIARRNDKEITNRLEMMLITTFVTPMEREDIEALADTLYKIPKTIEKFAERYIIVADQIRDVDFTGQVKLIEQAIGLVFKMTEALKDGRDLTGIKALQVELQRIEAEADRTLLNLMSQLYQPGYPPLKAVMLYDLFALNEKAVDRCRDAGNVLSHVLLKNS